MALKRPAQDENECPTSNKRARHIKDNGFKKASKNPVKHTRKGENKCHLCGKAVTVKNLPRHMRTCHESPKVCYDCTECSYQSCSRLDYYRQHYTTKHLEQKNYLCSKCGWQLTHFSYYDEPHLESCIRYTHRESANVPLEPITPPLQEYPTDSLQVPSLEHPFWQEPVLQAEMPEVENILKDSWKDYRQRFITHSNLAHKYYFRTIGVDVPSFNPSEALKYIYSKVNVAFNCNIGTTTLLKKEEKNKPTVYQIIYAQINSKYNLFEKNLNVHNRGSLQVALEKVRELGDLTERVEKPDTLWKYVCTLSIGIFVYLRPNFIAGMSQVQLPDYLVYNNKNLVLMDRDKNQNKYNDNLCFFRCYLCFLNMDYDDKALLRDVYEEYRCRVSGPSMKKFTGLPQDHIPLVEQIYNVSIQIFRKTSKHVTGCLRKATPDNSTPIMNLHSYLIDETKTHFSLITNLNNFAGKHTCPKCLRMFKAANKLDRHTKFNCKEGEPLCEYPGGSYEAVKTIFDQLLEFGIVIEKERRYCEAFACWDCEALLSEFQQTYELTGEINERTEQGLMAQNIIPIYSDNAKRLQIREKHRVISTSLMSTVPGWEHIQFFQDKDPRVLMSIVYEVMIKISDTNYEYQKAVFSKEFERLDELVQQVQLAMRPSDRKAAFNKKREKSAFEKIQRVRAELDRYCRQLTLISFNCSHYDLNLVKHLLYPKMVEAIRKARQEGHDHQPWPKSINRGNTVMCLSTNKLRFIDALLYIAPGVNLDKFIKAFNPDGERKGHFPYELIRRSEDLENITECPSKSDFFSTLKNGGITDDDYAEFSREWQRLEFEANKNGQNMNMLRILEWYNNRDVKPLLEACRNMAKMYWKDFEIDIFKQALSIPGVCLAYLFKELHKRHPSISFGLFNEEQAQLTQDLYGSICGGLSVIVQRFAEVGRTPIRGNPEKLVKKIVGWDSNALYLWGICQHMPTGYADHWKFNAETAHLERSGKTFAKRLKERKCYTEVECLNFAAWYDGVYIHHAGHGVQTSLGQHQHRVDGYAKDTTPKPRVYNFNGCKFHYHTQKEGCINFKLDLTNADPEIIQRDAEKDRHLRELGFDVCTLHECHWTAMKAVAAALRAGRPVSAQYVGFIDIAKTYNEYLRLHPKRHFSNEQKVSHSSMLKAIVTGKVFGFAKVDIETLPEKRDLYEDFPPIIKHAMISREDIGEYMKNIAIEKNELQKPRDALIGSYYGEGVWVMTPLLQFYQKRGVRIKKIYEVVQYDRHNVFKWFGETVTEHRKQGDASTNLAVLADAYKLLGNSSYGKTITNLKRHREVFYVDAQEMPNVHNSPYHERTEVITENCFEVHMRKKKVKFGLPMIIGLSVYAWAKLRMLQFLYDVIFEYIDKSDFMFLESDTDSVYLALAAETLEELVPADKLQSFNAIKSQWFVQDDSEKRTPGKFKVEKTAVKFVGLCSKNYILQSEDGKVHAKAKGVQLARNSEVLTCENAEKVLKGSEDATVKVYNVGFRMTNGVMCTYVQEKLGLNCLYIKRKTNNDGVSTVPLDL